EGRALSRLVRVLDSRGRLRSGSRWRRPRPKAASPRYGGVAGPAGASPVFSELHLGDLFEEDGLVDLMRDGSSDLTALAAALHEHNDHDLGILGGREGREPRVVLALGRIALVHALRSARLARDLDTGDARRATRPALVDHARQSMPQQGPHEGREIDAARHLAGRRIGEGAIDPLHALHQARTPEHAAVWPCRTPEASLHRS